MGMTSEQRTRCHAVIHIASGATAAVGAGLAQLPSSDNALITPIQLGMTLKLGNVFGLTLSQSAAEAAMASAAAAAMGRAASQVLLGWIPGVGNIVNACTAAALTESIGWLLAEDFSRRAA